MLKVLALNTGVEIIQGHFNRDWQLFLFSDFYTNTRECCLWLNVSEPFLILGIKTLRYGWVLQEALSFTASICESSACLCPGREFSYSWFQPQTLVLCVFSPRIQKCRSCWFCLPRLSISPHLCCYHSGPSGCCFFFAWLQPPSCSPCFRSCLSAVCSPHWWRVATQYPRWTCKTVNQIMSSHSLKLHGDFLWHYNQH